MGGGNWPRVLRRSVHFPSPLGSLRPPQYVRHCKQALHVTHRHHGFSAAIWLISSYNLQATSYGNQWWGSRSSFFPGLLFQAIQVPDGTRLGFPTTSQLGQGVFKQFCWAGDPCECPQHLCHTGVYQVPGLPKQLCELPECHLGAAFGIPIYNFLLVQWDHFPIPGVLMALPLAAFPSSSSHGFEHISPSRAWADWSHVSLWSWMACPVEYINSCVCTHAVCASVAVWCM